MQPCDTVLKSLLRRGTDHLLLIRNRNMSSLITVSVTFSKPVDQQSRILVAVIYDTCHRNNASVNVKLCLQLGGMIPECDQRLLKLIYRSRHLQTFLIDKTHIADRLDRCLLGAKLLDPGKRPNMALRIGTHFPIFRKFVKYRFQIRHISIDILL